MAQGRVSAHLAVRFEDGDQAIEGVDINHPGGERWVERGGRALLVGRYTLLYPVLQTAEHNLGGRVHLSDPTGYV